MKKWSLWLFASLFVAAFTLTACGDDDDEDTTTATPPTVQSETSTEEVTTADLKGTWDGEVEHDFAQGYYQRWRIAFDGNSYTSWHTHQTAGATGDDVQGLKTVGNKEQGTWEYKDGTLVLTPSKQWASYVITSMSPTKYTYYNYNIETMESDQWYETPDYILQQGIERDLQDGTDWYISKWLVTDFTNTQLSIMINRDTFKLTKQ